MQTQSVTRRTLHSTRQTCRIKVRINGDEHVVRLIFAHQRPEGMNEVPLGDRVYLDPLGWFNTDEVEFLEVLPWNNLPEILATIVAAHNDKRPALDISIELQGTQYPLVGTSQKMVDISTPMMPLLQNGSTPTTQVLDENAGYVFEYHARKLIEIDQEFYTVLQPMWNLPAILWKRK